MSDHKCQAQGCDAPATVHFAHSCPDGENDGWRRFVVGAQFHYCEKHNPEPAEVVTHFATVNYRPGDTLVLMHERILGERLASQLADGIKRVFGNDVQAIVLEEGMKLGVVRREQALDARAYADAFNAGRMDIEDVRKAEQSNA